MLMPTLSFPLNKPEMYNITSFMAEDYRLEQQTWNYI